MDVTHFQGFLLREKQLLIASGLDSYIADIVSSRISDTIGHMRSNPTTSSDLERHVSQLRQHVCNRGETTIQALKNERPARGLVYGLGGIALVAVNIAADGLSTIGIGASAGIGGSLVKDGVQILLEAISSR